MKGNDIKKIKHVRLIKVSNYHCSWYDEITSRVEELYFLRTKRKRTFNRIIFSVAVTSHHVINIVLPYAYVIHAGSTVTVSFTDVSLFVVTALSRRKLHVVQFIQIH
jgi:hypothetical protein